MYIYTSNETPNIDVFFDNLQVTHTRGPILEETHYYPFGLVMKGVSSNAFTYGIPQNKYKFNNGSELQSQEFSDGAGFEMYETVFRGLDPQIGRFAQPDPIAETTDNWSSYVYVQNNPLLYNDPLGLDTTVSINGGQKLSLTSSEVASAVTVSATRSSKFINPYTQITTAPVLIYKSRLKESNSNNLNIGYASGGGIAILSNPEVYPVVAVGGALVLTYYLLQSINHNDHSGYTPPPGFLVRDNTSYTPPAVIINENADNDLFGEITVLAEKTADQLLPGSLKRSPSYNPQYENKTRSELEELAKQGDVVAGKMKKLVDQIPRLLKKNRNK